MIIIQSNVQHLGSSTVIDDIEALHLYIVSWLLLLHPLVEAGVDLVVPRRVSPILASPFLLIPHRLVWHRVVLSLVSNFNFYLLSSWKLARFDLDLPWRLLDLGTVAHSCLVQRFTLSVDHANRVLKIVVLVVVQFVEVMDSHKLLSAAFSGALVLQVAVNADFVETQLSNITSAERSHLLLL